MIELSEIEKVPEFVGVDKKIVVIALAGYEPIMAEFLEGNSLEGWVLVVRPLVVVHTISEGMPFLYYKKIISGILEDDTCNYRFEKPTLVTFKEASEKAAKFYNAAAAYMFDKTIVTASEGIYDIFTKMAEEDRAKVLKNLQDLKDEEGKEGVKDSAEIAANTSIN